MKLKYQLCDTANSTNKNLMDLVQGEPHNIYLCRTASVVFVSDMRYYSDLGFYFVHNEFTYEFDDLNECWLIGDY